MARQLLRLWLLLVLLLGCLSCTTRAVRLADAPAPGLPLAWTLEDRWDDRAVYSAGLVGAEQKWLGALNGASVYHIELQIGDDMLSLQGRERVRYTNRATAALAQVYFQLFPNMEGGEVDVSGVTVGGKAVQAALEPDRSSLAVPLPVPLPPGQSTVLQLDFGVRVPAGAGGNYGLFAFNQDILVLDGFYPAIPVYDEQGWHHGPLPANADTTFQDASFYLVRVSAPARLVLASSGNQVERALDGQRQVATFAAGPARDFYLAGSEKFVVTSRSVGETKVNSYAFAERAAGAKQALDTAAAALASYSTRVGAYPYTEFDLLSTPMQDASGIEYPGIAGINLNLYDPSGEVNGTPASIYLEGTVAHEVGHQWFYNVVGNDQHNAPWLDEALTQYLTGTYYLDNYGPAAFASYRASWLARWDRVQRKLIPIGLPAANYMGSEYGAIVYGRGPLFFEALAQKMGQPVFDEFLRDYFQVYHWRVASPAGLQQLAEKHCSCDLQPLFTDWVKPK